MTRKTLTVGDIHTQFQQIMLAQMAGHCLFHAECVVDAFRETTKVKSIFYCPVTELHLALTYFIHGWFEDESNARKVKVLAGAIRKGLKEDDDKVTTN